jgi:hypothetical protein
LPDRQQHLKETSLDDLHDCNATDARNGYDCVIPTSNPFLGNALMKCLQTGMCQNRKVMNHASLFDVTR